MSETIRYDKNVATKTILHNQTECIHTNILIASLSLYFVCFCANSPGAFRLYDVDNDGFITRDEMYNIVDAIYQMVVSKMGSFWGLLVAEWITRAPKTRVSRAV